MTKSLARYFTLILSLILLCACGEQENAVKRPPPAIGVQVVQTIDYQQKAVFPARVSALRAAEIRPQVDGIIKQRLFNAGDNVKAGQSLYQLDDSVYRAEHAQAKAATSKAQAVLDTQFTLFQRAKTLLKQQAISQQALDEAEQSYLSAAAELEQAKAVQRLAALNLEYSQIKSPIAGRVEISSVTEGALVSAKQAEPLTTVYQLDPIYVDITVSGAKLHEQRSLWQQQQLHVQLLLENGERYPINGELEFISAAVGESSAANLWRAKFSNPDHTLLPGMFVQAELIQRQAQQVPVVPQRALLRHPNGDPYVWVLKGDSLESRNLVIGEAINDMWLVREGVSSGEKIAVDGLQNARANQPIQAVDVVSEK